MKYGNPRKTNFISCHQKNLHTFLFSTASGIVNAHFDVKLYFCRLHWKTTHNLFYKFSRCFQFFFFSIRLYVSCQDKIAFAPDFNGSIVPALANAPKSSSLVNSCVAHGFSVGSANVIKETYFFGGIAYLSIFHCQKLYTIASTRMQCNTVRGSVNTVDGTRFILPFSFHFVVPCSVCVCASFSVSTFFFFFLHQQTFLSHNFLSILELFSSYSVGFCAVAVCLLSLVIVLP